MNRSDGSMEQPSMAPPSDQRSDTELVAAIAAGDRGALETLYRRHEPWLAMRLARRCADRAVVDEVVQDTFVAVWRTADRYAGTGEVAAWIWGIGIRRLLQALRPRKPLLERLRGLRADETASAEEQVLLGIEHGGLADALAGLSPELRAVVQATILDGLTTNEAARLLGIPSGTVKTRMMRARREMREALA
jgi:RNA polymerase sigma-70 factor (ECF subfamily)